MKACKSKYDYDQLISNWVEVIINKHEYIDKINIKDCFISTAKNRMHFIGTNLYSYNTVIAKANYVNNQLIVFINSNQYSKTTTKQVYKLIKELTENEIKYIFVLPSFNLLETVQDIYNNLIDTYKTLHTKRNMIYYKQLVNSYIEHIKQCYKYASKGIKSYLAKSANLPNIPNRMDKFTRPAFKHIVEKHKF